MKQILNNQKGFSVKELVVAVVVFGVVAACFIGFLVFAFKMVTKDEIHAQAAKVVCIDGYKFSQDVNGNSKQMVNESGNAITCSK